MDFNRPMDRGFPRLVGRRLLAGAVGPEAAGARFSTARIAHLQRRRLLRDEPTVITTAIREQSAGVRAP